MDYKLIFDQQTARVFKSKRCLSESDQETREFFSNKKSKFNIDEPIKPVVIPLTLENLDQTCSQIPLIDDELVDKEDELLMKGNRLFFFPCNKCIEYNKCLNNLISKFDLCENVGLVLNFVEYLFLAWTTEKFEVRSCAESKDILTKELIYDSDSSLSYWDKYEKQVELSNVCSQKKFYLKLIEETQHIYEAYNDLVENEATESFLKNPEYLTYCNNLPDNVLEKGNHATDYVIGMMLYNLAKDGKDDPYKRFKRLMSNYNLGCSTVKEQIELAFKTAEMKFDYFDSFDDDDDSDYDF